MMVGENPLLSETLASAGCQVGNGGHRHVSENGVPLLWFASESHSASYFEKIIFNL